MLKEVFQGRETMGWRILVYREVILIVAIMVLGGKGGGKGFDSIKEIISGLHI